MQLLNTLHRVNSIYAIVKLVFIAHFFALWNLVVFSFGPPIMMLIFGLLTLRHIRQTRRVRDRLSNANQHQNLQNTNRHFLRMLLVQCVVVIITSAPFSIGWLYVSLTPNQDIIQVAKNNLLTGVVGYLSVTGPCISFYLFTLSSSLFRRQLRPLFKWCFCCSQAQPANLIT